MADKIKVLVADDIAATRENIAKLMEFHTEIILHGQAADAEEAIKKAKELQPDIVLMDINMPGMDGITATEILAAEVPTAGIVIMSVQGEQEYLRRAMLAGAKNYLVKPFTGDELLQAIKQVYANEQKRRKALEKKEIKEVLEGKIFTVFSTKGGIGKTTIATNLAVALAQKTGARVGLVDADLQFGDVALFLNLMPRMTIADLGQDMDHLDSKVLDAYMVAYNGNVRVLPAPLRPELAEMISGTQVAVLLKMMRTMFDYIIVDTAPAFNDIMLSILDASDQVLVVSALDLPTTKNVKLGLEVMESLGYAEDKMKLVLNRANSDGGMERKEVEATLRYRFAAALPSDGKVVVSSVNRGIPFVTTNPEAPVSQEIYHLINVLVPGNSKERRKDCGVIHRFKRLFA